MEPPHHLARRRSGRQHVCRLQGLPCRLTARRGGQVQRRIHANPLMPSPRLMPRPPVQCGRPRPVAPPALLGFFATTDLSVTLSRPGLSLAGVRLTVTRRHRGGLLCCVGLLSQTCHRHYPGGPVGGLSLSRVPQRRPSPFLRWVGVHIIRFEAGHRPKLGPAFTRVTACLLAESPYAILSIEGFDGFVTSTAAPIATGWSDYLPGGT
jgi:hypothetical protein